MDRSNSALLRVGVLSLLLVAACSGGGTTADGGLADSDAGRADAGPVDTDGGLDAGPVDTDGGVDAGFGGETITGDGARVVIPPGAPPPVGNLHVAAVDSPVALPPGYDLVGSVYAFSPHHVQFVAPVTLSLPIPEGAGTHLAVLTLSDEDDQTWEAVSNVTFAGDEASFPSMHFSFYALTHVDPCSIDNGGCDPLATCGTWNDQVVCSCPPRSVGNGTTCSDLDECAQNAGGCSSETTCVNTSGGSQCACPEGFALSGATCVDVDECALNHGGCGEHASCTNTEGSFACACDPGYAQGNEACEDVDECDAQAVDCGPATCVNTSGGALCTCPGSTEILREGECVDVGACAVDNGGCDPNADCLANETSVTCTCRAGFVGDGSTCLDLNECAQSSACPSFSRCENLPGTYACNCFPGHLLVGSSCRTCAPGYADQGPEDRPIYCADVNECATNNGGCGEHATCTNTVGAFSCACDLGYVGDGHTCTRVPKALVEGEWTKSFALSGFSPSGILPIDASHLYLASTFNPSNTGTASAARLARYSSSQGLYWQAVVDGPAEDLGTGLAPGPGGATYLAGYSASPLEAGGGDVFDIFLARYSESGEREWLHQVLSPTEDRAAGVAADADGAYVVGWANGDLATRTRTGQIDLSVVAYAPDGAQRWIKRIAGGRVEYARGIGADGNGSLYVVGQTDGSFPGTTHAGGWDMLIAKLTTSGDLVWIRQFGTSADDSAAAVLVDESGHLLVGGTTGGVLQGQVSAGKSDCLLLKLSAAGEVVWARQWGTAEDDVCHGKQPWGHGGLAAGAAGQILMSGGHGPNNTMLARFDANGNLLERRDLAVVQDKAGTSIATDGTGALYFAGGTGRDVVTFLRACTGPGFSCPYDSTCAESASACDVHASCLDSDGGMSCICPAGYAGTNVCTDIDECLTDRGGCSSNATCTNTPGSHQCTCKPGYAGDGVTCVNIDECATNNGGCSPDATCADTQGSRSCTCKTGYQGNGLSCSDVNECLTNNGGCSSHATCTNTPGHWTCTCNEGFEGDGISCTPS